MNSMTIAEIRAGLQAGAFSSQELTEQYLKKIREHMLNAFLSVNDRAEEQARAADRARRRNTAGSLTGVPFAAKDVLATSGTVTTAGSNMLANYLPPYTATAVQRLLDAGMVLLGKTNCDEFAMGSSNENSAFGPVFNPHDAARVPGGSSGGSAAAVAAGLCPVALGSDTGGSVRLPAAFCGVVGLKPTYGRVSRYGLIAMASSLDHVGILSCTTSDAAEILSVIAGHDALDATSARMPADDYAEELDRMPSAVTLGVPREYRSHMVDQEMRSCFESALDRFSRLRSVSIREISLPHTEYALAAYYIIMPSEVSANLARYDGLRFGRRGAAGRSFEEWFARNRDALGPEVRRRIMLGTYALSAGYFDAYYLQAAKVRSLVRRDFDRAFEQVDAIIAPTAPTPAFKLGEKFADPLTMYLSDIYTVPANLAGIPALSVPAGTVRGLPAGVQIMGRDFEEQKLLALARAFELASKNV